MQIAHRERMNFGLFVSCLAHISMPAPSEFEPGNTDSQRPQCRPQCGSQIITYFWNSRGLEA